MMVYLPLDIGQPPAFFVLSQSALLPFFFIEAHFAGSQSFISPHLEGSQAPAAAGFTFALLAQQLLASPAAAGFALAALAAAIGHASVPILSQPAFMPAHLEGSQFAGSQFDPSHCAAVALALTFSVLLQPIVAKPIMATRVRVSSCFIEFSIWGLRGYALSH